MGHPEVAFWPFVVASLAVWRVTHLLQAEDGPWDLVARLRAAVGDGTAGRMFDCFYCLSVWVALPFVPWLSGEISSGLIVWAALSGAAILLERISGERPPPTAAWHEDPPT